MRNTDTTKAHEKIHQDKLKRIEEYNLNPTKCLVCKIIFNYKKRHNKFCNRSCAAKHNNSCFPKRINKIINTTVCLNCNKVLKKIGKVYCDVNCQQSFSLEKRTEKMLELGEDDSRKNNVSKKYLIKLHKGCCQLCNLDLWSGQSMPLVLDHIDGNPYNNSLVNLRVICNNCDALTPFFKGKNIGRGRVGREKYYKEFKELKDENDLFRKSKDKI